MNLAGAVGKAKEIPVKLKGALGAFLKVMANLFDYLTACLRRGKRNAGRPFHRKAALRSEKINAFQDRFLYRFPEGKRKPVFFGLAGLVLLFFILIIVLIASPGKSAKPASQAMGAVPVIAQDDLFMPAEPDFLPEFLLERDPRHSWSLDDIVPYWKSPEKTGLWQEEIKSAVDKLMEGVP